MSDTVGHYFAEIRDVIIASHKVLSGVNLKLISTSRRSSTGTIRTSSPLDFGSFRTLKISEEVTIENGLITRPAYSFNYEERDPNNPDRVTYYFRYEKAPDDFVPNTHPICHLHANKKEPRFMTHETNALEVFHFVLANFLS